MRKIKPQKRWGNVTVSVNRSRLRITFSSREVNTTEELYYKRHFLSCGLSDTPLNWRRAEQVALHIQRDLEYRELDKSLQRYRMLLAGFTPEDLEQLKKRHFPELLPLWQQYTRFKSKTLQQTTIKRDYERTAKILKKIPAEVGTPHGVELWLLENYSPTIAKRVLEALSGCFSWAQNRDLATSNPFQAIARSLKPLKKDSERTRQAFTSPERLAIIQEFKSRRPEYAPMVEFAFLTGCRPGELAGLRWQHITETHINFCESLPSDLRIRKDIKTHKPRQFPINGQLASVIAQIQGDRTPDSSVFCSVPGVPINTANFRRRIWVPLLEDMVKRGLISRSLPFNNCRHTAWTSLREAGLPPDDIARLLGHNTVVGMKHYSGDRPLPEVPEL